MIMQTQLVSAGLVPGVADLVVWWPDPPSPLPLHRPYTVRVGYVEIKTEAGNQSKNQQTFQKKCIECGIEYAVIRSLEDMKRLVEVHNG